MAQKTIIGDNNPNVQTPAEGPDSLYGRSADNGNIKRTYIQGMKPRVEDQDNNSAEAHQEKRALHIELQSRPVAGVLYSVSCDGCGEIYPVYVGRNTIGSNHECDVYLCEETVSPNHAVLLVRAIENENGRQVTMSLTDYDSEFGTAVNGIGLGYDREPLKGNEIIQIGNAYRFVFIPLDAASFGLEPEKGFISTPRKENKPTAHPNSEMYNANNDTEVYPNSVGADEERNFYGRSIAKKEDHSSKKTINY